MGRKWGAVPIFGGGAGSPFNTMLLGPRPTFMPSFIFIRPTVWPQYTNVTDKTDRQDNCPIAQSEPFYKRSPKWTILLRVFKIFSRCYQNPAVDSLQGHVIVRERAFEPQVQSVVPQTTTVIAPLTDTNSSQPKQWQCVWRPR